MSNRIMKIACPPGNRTGARVDKDAAFGARAASLSQPFEALGELKERRRIMATNYASEKLTAAIRDHLLRVDAVPPTAEASKLAQELAQVCLNEFNTVGVKTDTVENLFAFPAYKAKARGVD